MIKERTKIKHTKELVEHLLEIDPKCRVSDEYLAVMVYSTIHRVDRLPDMKDHGFYYALLHISEWGYPSFETIRRTRQKVQAEHPEWVEDKCSRYRLEKEIIYRKEMAQ